MRNMKKRRKSDQEVLLAGKQTIEVSVAGKQSTTVAIFVTIACQPKNVVNSRKICNSVPLYTLFVLSPGQADKHFSCTIGKFVSPYLL